MFSDIEAQITADKSSNNRVVNILVVDDEPVVLESIRRHLRYNENFNVTTCASVDEALKILNLKGADIIITDLMMPKINGLEFLKILSEMSTTTLSIMITGYATINTAIQATQLGAFDYIAKPFTRLELRKIVERAAILTQASEKSGLPEKAMPRGQMKGVGEYSWLMSRKDGDVLIGVERSFLLNIGRIQSVYLPDKSDQLRQGSVYFQVFASDLRTQSLLCPLSGEVIEVNQRVISDPNSALQDPYGDGWLIVLKPSNFESEIKMLGLG